MFPNSPSLLHSSARAIACCAILTAIVLFSQAAKASDLDVSLAPGVVLTVAPDTVYRKLAPRTLTLLHGKTAVAQVLSLQSGQLQATVQAPGAVMILTSPRVSAICINGQMAIARNNGKTMVANVEGSTVLAGPKGLSPLPPGLVKTWALGKTTQADLPPAPSFALNRSLWVDSGNGASLAELWWPAVEGASGYELVVAGSAVRVASIRTVDPSLRDHNLALRPGSYQLRLRAIDANGLPGKLSPPVPIRVTGLVLPPGAYVDAAGIVRLGEGQRVSFTGADDVVVTTRRGNRFHTETGDVGLEVEDALTVWFRPSDSPRPQASIRIEPRQFNADVTFRPGAGWPADPLFIAVRVKGTNGQPAPAWLRPKAHVTVGIKSFDVAWKISGDAMSAVLATPPNTPGPWVVRVQVEDQYGVPIGRDFLELGRGTN